MMCVIWIMVAIRKLRKAIRQHLARTLIDPNSLMLDGFSNRKILTNYKQTL